MATAGRYGCTSTSFAACRVLSRFTTNPYSKPLLLLYLTLALVFLGATGIFAVSRESFYEAFWEAIAGVRALLSIPFS